MKQVNAMTDQLEDFANDLADDFEKVKDAFSRKNWKAFCQEMQPILQKAEDLGMTTKGTAEKIYNKSREETVDFYIRAAHFAADATKSFAEQAQKMGKKCSSKAKNFFSALKDFAMTVFKETKALVHNLAHEAHKQGKSFVEKIGDAGKDLFAKMRNKN